MKSLLVPAVVLALCAACAAGSRSGPGCEPVPAEFRLPDQEVYRGCAVDRTARPVVMPRTLDYMPPANQTCIRAAIDVVVDSTGRPVSGTARVVRTNDAGFASALLRELEGFRYEPATKDGRPVAQLVRVDRAITAVAVARGTSPQSARPRRPPC